jgi:hypothetical protein
VTFSRTTEADLLAATSRKLSEEGYDVIIEPSPSLLPGPLKKRRPDAIAIGRLPNLAIEVASDRPNDAQRVAELQRALKGTPDWKLHLVFNRASGPPELAKVSDSDIPPLLSQALNVAQIDTRAALLMGWAALEALSRSRRPDEFARPQSPGRIVERLASQGIIAPSEAALLRSLAAKRTAFVHGALEEKVDPAEISAFVAILNQLLSSPVLRSEVR